jgi:hypothetical protein
LITGPERNRTIEIAPPLFTKEDASFDLSIMEVNFVSVARPRNAMDTVGWRTWTPGLPQSNTNTNCISTPVGCIDATRSEIIAKHNVNQWF